MTRPKIRGGRSGPAKSKRATRAAAAARVEGDGPPDAPAASGGSALLETEEIIEHVAQGKLTPRNPRLRKISDPLKIYLDRVVARQKWIDRQMEPLQKAVREFPEEQREIVYALLRLSNENSAHTRDRELLRRAVPLIEAFRQQGRRLRRDRDRAFDFIAKLKAKVRDLELFGLGPAPEKSEDHWPENDPEGGENLREP